MTSESPTPNEGARPFNPKFRRRKRYQGATWTPNTQSAEKQDGAWCPRHRMRHGYKSSTLGLDFEKGSNGKWKLLWFCASTGDVLEELELNNDNRV